MSNKLKKEEVTKEVVQENTVEEQPEGATENQDHDVKIQVKVVEKPGLFASVKGFFKKPAVKKVGRFTMKGVKLFGKGLVLTGAVLAALEVNERKHPTPDGIIELDPDSYDKFISAASTAAAATPALLEDASSNVVDVVSTIVD